MRTEPAAVSKRSACATCLQLQRRLAAAQALAAALHFDCQVPLYLLQLSHLPPLGTSSSRLSLRSKPAARMRRRCPLHAQCVAVHIAHAPLAHGQMHDQLLLLVCVRADTGLRYIHVDHSCRTYSSLLAHTVSGLEIHSDTTHPVKPYISAVTLGLYLRAHRPLSSSGYPSTQSNSLYVVFE